jgi:uncharacterized membrane protein
MALGSFFFSNIYFIKVEDAVSEGEIDTLLFFLAIVANVFLINGWRNSFGDGVDMHGLKLLK